MSTSTLLSMLGANITNRTLFQWVKIFGSENIYWDKAKSDMPLVNRDYIVTSFYDSKKQGRTSDALANIMLYAYYGWVQKPENARVTGYIAEEVHNRIMRSISTYWNRPWQPDKHRCPIYGILNLFNIVKRYTQSDLLPSLGVKHSSGKDKQKANKHMVDSWKLGASTEWDKRSSHQVTVAPMTNIYIDKNHPIADWGIFNGKTPLEVLIHMETSNGV